MSWTSDDEWNLSLCMVTYDHGSPYNFRRLADYWETDKGTYQLKWFNEAQVQDVAEPTTFYHPELINRAADLTTDFVNIKWKLEINQYGTSRTRVWKPTPEVESRLRKLEPIEYIDCHDVESYTQFRSLLREGIPCYGKPTDQFLVSFAEGDNPYTVKAVLLNKKDVNFRDEKIILEHYEPGRLLSADVYHLEIKNIRQLSASSHGKNRYIYEATLPSSASGKFSVRPLEDYVSDYVKWFSNTQDVNLTRTERKKISQLVNKALGAPQALEEYVGANPSDEEVSAIRSTLRRSLHFDQDIMSELAVRILEEDEAFQNECKQMLLSGDDPEMQALHAEKEKLVKEREEAQAILQELRQTLATEHQELEAHKNKRTALEVEVQSITEQKTQIFQRLQEDIALRIGLGTVAAYATQQSSVTGSTVHPQLVSHDYFAVHSNILSTEHLLDAFSKNMRYFGMKMPQHGGMDLQTFANNILLTLSATNILAINSSFASVIANALSVALKGVAASHIVIPESYADADTILAQCEQHDCAVVVLDNVLDTLNEGLLFALSRAHANIIVILPVGARGNLKMLAPEVWEHIFYIPTDAFACIPVRDIENTRMCKCVNEWTPEAPSGKIYADVLDIEHAAINLIESVAPMTSWYIPLEIEYMFEQEYASSDDELDAVTLHEWIGPQLLLIAYSNGGYQEALNVQENVNDSNWNAMEFLERLTGNHER